MKPVEITWKSTLCREYGYKGATEYRVLFEDIPDYIKDEWLEYAKGIGFSDEEIKNPRLEMELKLYENGDVEFNEFKYYFDDYVSFRLHDEDEDRAIDVVAEFIKKHDKGLPDAYNKETDELMGDGDWILAAYGKEN